MIMVQVMKNGRLEYLRVPPKGYFEVGEDGVTPAIRNLLEREILREAPVPSSSPVSPPSPPVSSPPPTAKTGTEGRSKSKSK